jgi:DNA polymerase-1
MAKWVLIDGFNLAFRCFHAVPGLARKDGFPTNALYGWVRGLWRLWDEEQPQGWAVFYDLGGSSAREALLPDYKANRSETPPALVQQIPLLKQAASAIGLASIEREGVESDDLLASHAARLAAAGEEVWIASGDKDFAQLVGPSIRLLVPPPSATPKAGWTRLDAAGVLAKFGVRPDQIADYLALVGDTVDNIPGLDGVGPKTASRWLERHGTLEGVLAAAAEIEPERFREKLAAAAVRLRMNRQLTRLDLTLADQDLPAPAPRPEELIALLEAMEMRSHAAEARERYEPRLF